VLTKYYAMKTYPVLNEEPHYEDTWGIGGIATHILNIIIKWM